MDNDDRFILKYYLDSPILEIAEPTAELPELNDSTSSSYIPSFEYDLTNIIKEESVESFTSTQEHISSSSIMSNEEQPAEPSNEMVETSSSAGGPPDLH